MVFVNNVNQCPRVFTEKYFLFSKVSKFSKLELKVSKLRQARIEFRGTSTYSTLAHGNWTGDLCVASENSVIFEAYWTRNSTQWC